MNEIKFYGRGGQGVVMASHILGMAFFNAGMYPQCYSLFGGERRGAPVVSFLRIDKHKIVLKCDIKNPDELLCFDSNLVSFEEILNLMQPGGKILINTSRPAASFEGLSRFTLGLVDASSIAENLGLGHVINTAVLGAYCRLTEHLHLDHLIEAVEEMVPAEKEINVKAVKQGYAGLKIWAAGKGDDGTTIS
jgi:2-oxoacid:acceptor oxidoreductase gamma subunit (pyruvate/2-ketoisovalerate family)